MNLIPQIFRRSPSAEKRSSLNPAGLFSAAWDLLSGTHNTASGQPINETIAVQHLTVYACVRVIAEAVGSMTVRLYSRTGNGRQEAIDHPLHYMFAVEPNPEMNASTVWEQVAGCMALTGNSYCEILRNTQGSVVGIYPLDPRLTEPVRLPNGQLAYKTRVGLKEGQQRTIAAKDMLHFPLWGWDGLKGCSPIQQARNDIGLAMASTKFGAKFFGNSTRAGGLLQPETDVSPEDMTNMRTFWEEANSSENQGRISVLPKSWKYTQLSLSPEESQFLGTRQFSRTDIAALFRLSPSQVGDVTKASKASAEQDNINFVIDCLRPYLVRIEREIQRKLFPRDPVLFVEFDISERLRGDFVTTMQGFAVARQWGFYSANMVLEKLGENPIGPQGDVFWAPVNMTNAKNLMLPAADPPPKPLMDPPTGSNDDPASRHLLHNYAAAYSRVFTDAVGRVASRSSRDAQSLTPILSPVLDSLSALIVDEARSQFGLPDSWEPSDKVVRDCIKSVASRADKWTPDDKFQIAVTELDKAIRSIHFSIFREAGAAIAENNPLKGNCEDDK